MNYIYDQWLSAINDISHKYDAMIDSKGSHLSLPNETEIEALADSAYHARNLPVAILAIQAWRDGWDREIKKANCIFGI